MSKKIPEIIRELEIKLVREKIEDTLK